MTHFPKEIEEYVRRMAYEQAAAIEAAIEEAVQGGVCGVMVTRWPTGETTAHVCRDVPYGRIYEWRVQ